MELEQRYTVLKNTDLQTIPKKVLDHNLFPVLVEAESYRKQQGKPPLECLVIEKDWPEYQPALAMLSDRVDGNLRLWCSVPKDMLEHADMNRDKAFEYRVGFSMSEGGIAQVTYETLACTSEPREPETDLYVNSPRRQLLDSEAPVVKHSHYKKDVRHLDMIDVYRVCALFNVTDPAIQHAVKKLLCPGKRGAGKTLEQDYKEARDSIDRALAMIEEDKNPF